ncbi:uncharacterized protein LOC108743855 isoform X2 [Agrilus planipennis]|uniref:Uncharacterized protein LOC108743855 isoform X1 n=1 Tax=Agrilus planipennis TaxID=224129 RepID=A0A1W4XR43_AGRPL|nr:uncharacterized protein LOC108743855 isoform X1 [Agrilus planipennis]XP_025835296.1 uncharacterized protein LOC108743855 isoform X2 [Agrilus planipennis]
MSGAKCDDELAEKTHSDNEVHEGGDEEDIPEDFFDDFSNQDFMAGLDVVDAWDDEETNDLKKSDSENTSKDLTEKDKNGSKSKELKKSEQKQESRKTDRRRRSSRERRYYRSRAASRDRHSEDRLKNTNSRELREERRRRERSSDRRRDPEKTRRDIQRDKDRRTKDEEAKIISEKLRMVETGLVPPGMEMDMDITTVKTAISDSKDENTPNKLSQEKLSFENQPTGDENQVRKSKRSSSKSMDFRRLGFSPPASYNIYGKRSPTHKSPLKIRGKSRSRSLRRSYRGRRSRSRSFGRGRSPVYLRKRSSPSRYYNSGKLTKSPSPGRKRRRSYKSPDSDVSDREVWLQRRREELRRSTSLELDNWPYKRENSSSNLRRHRDFLEDLERKLKKERSKDKKKRDFLREIHKKLNETGNSTENNSNVVRYTAFPTQIPGPGGPVHLHPNFMPVPHPIAPSIHIPVNPMMINQISLPGPPGAEFGPGPGAGSIQNSFNPGFGPHRMTTPVPAPYNRPEDSQYNEQFFIGHPSETALSSTVNISLNTQNSSKNIKTQNTVTMKNSEISIADLKNKDTVKKLFEEKKISLADYLSLTATESDPSKPVDIQNKIRVISRCQDAIKALDKPLPVDGRFVLKKSEQKFIDKISEAKGLSPLRKIPVVRFQFTTPSKGNEDKTTFSRTLEKVLVSIGLGNSKDASSSQDPMSIDTISSANINVNTIKSSFVKTKPVRAQDFMTGVKRHTKMCQTPMFLMKCQICEIRSARTYESVAIQCNIRNTVDMGVQCTEEKPNYQDAFKAQSLVHLTPAQILKQMGGKSEPFPGNQNGSKFDQARSRLTNDWFSGTRDLGNSIDGNIENPLNRQQMPLPFERSFSRPQPFDNRIQTVTDRPTQILDRHQNIDRQLLVNQPQMVMQQGQGLHDVLNNQFMQAGGIPNLLNMNIMPPRNRSNFNPFL